MSTSIELETRAVAAKAQGRGVSRIVSAAAIGTAFEWYDFVLYGALAGVLAKRFFAGVDPTTGFIFALLTFAVGFMMRPLGALVFGRLGDMVGRKKTFLVTVGIMGVATVGVGLLPDYATLGIAAPVLLISLRILQGFAVGGEYSGAMVYVAEHAPPSRRGLSTSWISASSTAGLLMSFGMILLARTVSGDAFEDWGWRIPFLFSLVLLAISVALRLRMDESPMFQRLKRAGQISASPVRDTFMDGRNLRRIFLAFSLCAGMTSMYYIAVLYPTFFLTQTLRLDGKTVNTIVLWVAAVGTPFFIASGWLCDRFGRKPVLLASFVLTALAVFPLFQALAHYGNPELAAAAARAPVTVSADTADCTFMFNPTGTRRFDSACDVARQALAGMGLDYELVPARAGEAAAVSIGAASVASYDGRALAGAAATQRAAAFREDIKAALSAAGYPERATPSPSDLWAIFALLSVFFCLSILSVTAIAPTLVELFPTRIRYTSMSVPYNIASGWVGGLLPTLVFAISVQSGNKYAGLWYPVGWAVLAAVALLLFYRETRGVDVGVDGA
ncbi:MFS transporter [Cupriavidus sp. 30B13]|uniref:MFS transporter n=1 Tax=Cupriavidus sp. 30B13 TaxID=3384241 RepID=UPI003B903F1E